MSNRAIWGAGLGAGFTWATAINQADLVSLANGSTVLSSVATITNQTALDIFCDISVRLTVGSATPPVGANISLYLAALLDDGTTFGDGSMASGGVITRVPPYAPVGVVPFANVALTLLAGYVQGIQIPPGSFRFALNNASGAALSATGSNSIVMYRTYLLNLNG